MRPSQCLVVLAFAFCGCGAMIAWAEDLANSVGVDHADRHRSVQLEKDPYENSLKSPSHCRIGDGIVFAMGVRDSGHSTIDGSRLSIRSIQVLPPPQGISKRQSDAQHRVRSYKTHFEINETPLSERGKWLNGEKYGRDWHDVLTRAGVAFGAESRDAYTDPTALLSGNWGKTQRVKARVFSRNQTEQYFQEVEIRLRSTLEPHLRRRAVKC